MTTITQVWEGFAAILEPWAVSKGFPVKWPDRGFNPPNSGVWLEVQWIPNETQNYGMANSGPFILQGLAQVTVRSRPGPGASPSLTVADEVIDLYAKGTLLHGVVRVYRSPWLSSVEETPSQTAKHVTVPWRGSA